VQVVNTTEVEIPGEFNIFPAQPPLKIGLSDKNVDFVEPDKEVYSSTQPYPSKLVEFTRQADLAGQGIAVIRVYPLQYVPSEKRLKLYTSISLVIEGVGGYECGDYLSPNISEKNRKIYDQMVKEMVSNPGDVNLNTAFKMSTSLVLPPGHFDHVIITSTTYASYFQPLVDWHNQKGVRDTIVLTSWIYSNYAGADTQKIRAFVIDAKNTWGTIYFLMGGETQTVPFGYRVYYDGTNTPSDQYYSDYNDNWVHDVFVGRVSVGSTTEITTFVNKVLKYEKDPPRTNYPLDVLLIAMDGDAVMPFEVLKDTIDNHIPARFNVTKVYDSDGGNHKDTVIYYLNAGQNLVNHAGHSNWNALCTGDINHGWCIYNGDVDNLTNNDQTSIVVSLGCYANAMDYSDCIAEHFVIYNPNQAGVAFTGNTRDGWYTMGDPFSLSNALDKEWWFALFDNNAYNLGRTLVYCKHHFSTSSGVEKHCEWTFNLLGEPEMPIWTDEPDSFAVAHKDTVPRGTSSFPVHVVDSTTHATVESAYVCLWKANEVYLTGYTNASGDISFLPFLSTEGIMYVTVSKHNYIPYQQEVEVYVAPYICGDANGDSVVDMTDAVYVLNYLYLYPDAPPPDPYEAGDANGDTRVDIADVSALIRHLYEPFDPIYCYGDRPCGDRGERDSLKIQRICGSAGDTVDVPIYVLNDDSMFFNLSLLIPDPSKAIFLDTVITELTRLAQIKVFWGLHDTTGINIHFFQSGHSPYDSTDYLVPGYGIVAHLRCVLKQDIPPDTPLCIDTTFFPPGYWTRFYTQDTYCIIPESKCILSPSGDVNGDCTINATDVVYLTNYLYIHGPAPVPSWEAGDVNCDGLVNAADVVYLVNYLYIGGPPPGCP
jgi:hypothetical protein